MLFWVNLARKNKDVDPTALVLHKDEIPVRDEGDTTIRTWWGMARRCSFGRRP